MRSLVLGKRLKNSSLVTNVLCLMSLVCSTDELVTSSCKACRVCRLFEPFLAFFLRMPWQSSTILESGSVCPRRRCKPPWLPWWRLSSSNANQSTRMVAVQTTFKLLRIFGVDPLWAAIASSLSRLRWSAASCFAEACQVAVVKYHPFRNLVATSYKFKHTQADIVFPKP